MVKEKLGAAVPGAIISLFPHSSIGSLIKPKFHSVDDSPKTHSCAESLITQNIPYKEEKVMK